MEKVAEINPSMKPAKSVKVNKVDKHVKTVKVIKDDKPGKVSKSDKIALVVKLSKNYTEIVSKNECSNHKELNWVGNGLGNRWCGKLFCYSVIYAKSHKIYNDKLDIAVIDEEKIQNFQEDYMNNHNVRNSGNEIIGIYVHYEISQETAKYEKRSIKEEIISKIKTSPCVNCGTNSELICDHKNDLYNNPRVLDIKTQTEDDFQCLCNRCNLLKRQVCKVEKQTNKLYSAKNIPKYSVFNCPFPWELKAFDINDPDLKKDTYWYDPIEFNNKVYLYSSITIPIIKEIKRKIAKGIITKAQ